MDEASAREQIAAWEARSVAHKAAMREAQALVTSLATLAAPKLSLGERLTLACQSFIARALDFPGRALLHLGSVAMLILGIAVLLHTDVLQLRAVSPGQVAGDLTEKNPALEARATFRTRRGEVQQHVLADGSSLWLDWNSRVEVAYTPQERRVLVHKGRARFAVAKDTSRPFRVFAADVEAKALGTEFVVNKLDFETVEVSVREGSVAVIEQSSADRLAVKPLETEEVLLVMGDGESKRSRRSVEEIGSWVDDVLLFDRRKLGDVLKTLQPYLGYRVDTELVIDRDRLVSGTFLTHRAEETLAVLMETFELETRSRGRGWVALQSVRDTRVH